METTFDFWKEIDKEVSERLARGETDFYNWDCIKNTMIVSENAPFIKTEFDSLVHWQLDDVAIDQTIPCKSLHTPNSIHHLYYLMSWTIIMEGKVDIARMNRIVEFGAGYGNLCRIIHEIGFNGEYIILDLPGMTKLQQHYLAEQGIKNVVWKSAPEEITDKADLLIGLWSLSEVPHSYKDRVLALPHKHELLVVRGTFDEHNNFDYFTEMGRYLEELGHIPGSYTIFS